MSTPLSTTLSCIVRGSGPGVLLAHGAGGSVQSNFGAISAPLAERFTVVAPDYPGSGQSPRATKPIELDELVDQCVVAAFEAGVKKFAILGYSTGCAIAVRAAIRYPTIVTALILTAGFAKLDSASQIRAEMLVDLAKAEEWEILAKFMVGSLISESFLDGLSLEQRGHLIKKSMRAIPGFVDQIDLTRKIDVTGDIPNVSVPTLIIHMMREHFISPRIGESLLRIPGAIQAELDCGHFPIGQGHEWLRLIQDFLIATEAVA